MASMIQALLLSHRSVALHTSWQPKPKLLSTRCILKAPFPKHIKIPKLSCSTPWSIHPLYNHVRQEYDELIVDVMAPKTDEARKHLLGQKLTLLACMLYPRASSTRLHLIIKLNLWFTMFDDAVDDIQGLGANFDKTCVLVEQYLNIVDRGGDIDKSIPFSPTHIRLLEMFASVWKAFQSDMPPHKFSKMKHDFRSMFALQAHVTKARQENTTQAVTPEEFIARKRVSGMHLFALQFLDYALGVEMEPEARQDPELHELYLLTADCMLFCNELLSFRMEFLSNDFDNILWIISHAENVTLDEAALRLKGMWDRNKTRLNQLHHSLGSRYSDVPGGEKLLQGARDVQAGYVEWCWQTGRYHGYAWTPPPQREGVMSLEGTSNSIMQFSVDNDPV